jgi:hypothetical protein
MGEITILFLNVRLFIWSGENNFDVMALFLNRESSQCSLKLVLKK